MNLLRIKLVLNSYGVKLDEDDMVLRKLEVKENAIFFTCSMCNIERGLSEIDKEEFPIVVCKICSKSIKIPALYRKQFKQGRL